MGLNLVTLFFIKEAVFNLNNVFWGLIGYVIITAIFGMV